MEHALTSMYVLSHQSDHLPQIAQTPSAPPVHSQNNLHRSRPSRRAAPPPSIPPPPFSGPRLRHSRLDPPSASARHRGFRVDTLDNQTGNMSRPVSSNRPTHIVLPVSPFIAHCPNGSPLPTPTGGMASPTSPRSSFLPSFMRQRSRAATVSNPYRAGATSPSVEAVNPLGTLAGRGGNGNGSSGEAIATTTTTLTGREGGGVTRSVSTPVTGGLSAHLPNGISPSGPSMPNMSSTTYTQSNGTVSPKTYRIRLVPHLETSRSLAFDPVVRELLPFVVPTGIPPSVAAASVTGVGPTLNGRLPALILKVGRFTDKASQLPVPATPGVGPSAGGTAHPGMPLRNGDSSGPGIVGGPAMTIAGGGGDVTSGKVAFKSKVVSRSHAEIWCEAGGKFYIRDTASSSGTFLNHIRLSSPNTESRPAMVNDGDVLQLGVDYQGGLEDMFRCVKMRVELGREWQRGANEFNTNALKQLKALGGVTPDPKGKAADHFGTMSAKKGKASVTDCCICLFSVTVCQSLFIAPCSHVFHYKCIRPLLMQHHPGFSCPLCRTFANLEEDVETEDAWEIASRRASIISRKPSHHSIRIPHHNELPPDAQSSSGIGFGPAAASVDELLGGESGIASEEGGMSGFASLARQVTAVQEGGSREAGDVDMPQALHEEDEIADGEEEAISEERPVFGASQQTNQILYQGYSEGISPGWDDNPDLSGSLAVLTDPSMLDRACSNSGSGPSTGIEPSTAVGTASSAARTALNARFAHALAPPMDERLGLERPITGEPPRLQQTNVKEENGESAPDTETESRSSGDASRTRADIDMMFT